MPAIVEFPTVIKEALEQFGHLFANEPARIHFAEYLTGLMVAYRKNVSAINREFAVTTDRSCLNRWLTAPHWHVERLNQERLAWLQKDPTTSYSAQGLIPLDNVLIDHSGKLIEALGSFWHHAEGRSKIAHAQLIINSVCTSSKHETLEFRRSIKKEQCRQRAILLRDNNEFLLQLLARLILQDIPGALTFAHYFTSAADLDHLHSNGSCCVAALKFGRNIVFCGETIKAEELAGRIVPEDRKPVRLGYSKQWYFTRSIRIP
jgi:hypothetical protein